MQPSTTVSTPASRSGAVYSRTVSTTCWSNGKPASMIAARSGHGTDVSFTNGSASAIARAYEPLSTVAGVASRPDAAVARRRHGLHGAGLDDAEHVDAERGLHQPRAQGRQCRRRRRVARHDEQLDPPCQQLVGDLEREPLELGLSARAVREPRGVREVDEVLGRQLHEQLVQDGQTAHAGVEHPDRTPAHLLGHGLRRVMARSRPPVWQAPGPERSSWRGRPASTCGAGPGAQLRLGRAAESAAPPRAASAGLIDLDL